MKKTLKALKDMKRFKARRVVVGGYCVEDIDKMRIELRQLLKDNNIDENLLIENDNNFSVKNDTRYWLKPKVSRFATGEIEIRSKDYLFHFEMNGEKKTGHGVELKSHNVTDYGFQIETSNGQIFEYHIEAQNE